MLGVTHRANVALSGVPWERQFTGSRDPALGGQNLRRASVTAGWLARLREGIKNCLVRAKWAFLEIKNSLGRAKRAFSHYDRNMKNCLAVRGRRFRASDDRGRNFALGCLPGTRWLMSAVPLKAAKSQTSQ